MSHEHAAAAPTPHDDGLQETPCPSRTDGVHCDHWWDGAACCACQAAPMTLEQKATTGMALDDEPTVDTTPAQASAGPMLATLYATTRGSGVTISIEVEVMRVDATAMDMTWVTVEALDDRLSYRVLAKELSLPNGDEFDADAARRQLEVNATT